MPYLVDLENVRLTDREVYRELNTSGGSLRNAQIVKLCRLVLEGTTTGEEAREALEGLMEAAGIMGVRR